MAAANVALSRPPLAPETRTLSQSDGFVTWHLYQYALLSPTNRIDPRGEIAPLVVAGIGAVVGGLSAAHAAANSGLTGAPLVAAVVGSAAIGAGAGAISIGTSSAAGVIAAGIVVGAIAGASGDVVVQVAAGAPSSACKVNFGSIANSAKGGAFLGGLGATGQVVFAGALPGASGAAPVFGAGLSGGTGLHRLTLQAN